ncbi:MAG: PrsW family glutamic-type intramembrane protease [Candidatus Jorgensenbacteria bacterium]|nr:PrsW family glutamic-type intramembrane protease [Candidatus Jorgensenbacteria bacterium]
MEIANVFVVLIAAFAPALAWLFFFLREDVHPEPRKLIAKVFIAGALVSVPTFLIQSSIEPLLKGEFTVLVIVLAFIEEFFKFGAAYLVVRHNKAFDEPIDAMIYMVAVSLGFATVENIFITGSSYPLSASLGAFLVAGGALSTLTYRFVGATLLHVLSSSLAGYTWARGWVKGRPLHFMALGLALATTVHAIFNFLIYRYQYENLLVPTLFLVLAGFFVLADFEKVKRIGV